MRRLPLLLALAAVAVLAAACAASTPPGWTYAPPTSPPPATPVPSATGAPSSEAPSGGAGIGSIQIAADNLQFDPREATAPADIGFVIHFDNQETGQPHNVEIKDEGGASQFKGDLVVGPAAIDYQVPALGAGTYSFVCTVHPAMTGVLAVN